MSCQPSQHHCSRTTACVRRKSQLAKEICKSIDVSELPQVFPSARCVVDGGYLLRALCWNSDATYDAVAKQYVAYADKHFGRSAIIVFDGYCNGPNTKDHEHQRRAKRYAPDIVVELMKTAYHDQSSFLGNDNKCTFVALLVTYLTSAGYSVQQAPDDADTLVAKVALDCASAKQVVSVIANHTNILVMLVCHYKPCMSDIFMSTKPGQSISSVAAIVKGLGPCASQLPVIHAISGCDTASSLFGHGKVSVFKKLWQSAEVTPYIDVLASPGSGHNEGFDAICKILALLCGGKVTDRLNWLRYNMYMQATAANLQLPIPEWMLPTENAARFHLYRVHLQALQWKLLCTSALNPSDWGWRLYHGKYIPVATDLEIAPPDVLKVACVKCSADSKRPCGTRACLCVRYGLRCISACMSCAGISCENGSDIAVPDDETDLLGIDDQQLVNDDCLEY